MKALACCGLIYLILIQNIFCYPDKTRTKRGTYVPDEMDEHHAQVFEELAEIGNDIDLAKNELLEHIHEHVESRLDHNEDILMQIRNNQRFMMLCRIAGNPCQNGGSCHFDEETDSYACFCSDEWTGTNCEELRDPCIDVECQNGGSCDNGICSCDDLYVGDYCEIGVCHSALEEFNALEMPMPGQEKPRCDTDGTYAPYQYRGSQAVCVAKCGLSLPFHMDRWNPEHENMDCECAREEHRRRSDDNTLPSLNCDINGSYSNSD